jgi:hypothetical protein
MAILEKVAAIAVQELAESNQWPVKPEKAALVTAHRDRVSKGEVKLDKGNAEDHLVQFEAPHRTAPYVIENLEDGQVRIKVTTNDGDVISGTGKDLDEALDKLEAKTS